MRSGYLLLILIFCSTAFSTTPEYIEVDDPNEYIQVETIEGDIVSVSKVQIMETLRKNSSVELRYDSVEAAPLSKAFIIHEPKIIWNGETYYFDNTNETALGACVLFNFHNLVSYEIKKDKFLSFSLSTKPTIKLDANGDYSSHDNTDHEFIDRLVCESN